MLGLATIFALTHRAMLPDVTLSASVTSSARVSNSLKLRFGASPAEFKDDWGRLEATGAGSLFQSYRWAEAWCRHVAPARGERPLIVSGMAPDGTIEFLLPLSVRRLGGLAVLGWLGQEHAGYNVGLYADGGRRFPSGARLEQLLRAICAAHPGIALIHLTSQPARWNNAPNPFASLPGQPAANAGHVLPIGAPFDTVYEHHVSKGTRTSLKRKEKKLGEFAGFAIPETVEVDERLRLLDVYFSQKARQFAEMGAPNVFAEPAIQEFYRDLCGGATAGTPVHQSFYARIGDRVLATANGVAHHGRFYLLTASLDEVGEFGKFSPGTVLFKEQIDRLSQRGLTAFDFGVGDGRHKAMWSPGRQELFETFLPISPAGWAYSQLRSGSSYAKRVIKNNERLYGMAKRMRRLIGGKPAATPSTDAE